MQFFLDTANLNEIQQAKDMGLLDGVTTNPSLIAKEGIKDIDNHYIKICQIVEEGDVSAEVISTDYDGMMKEGQKLAELHDNIVVKIPCTKDGIKAIHSLTDLEIPTNCTLIFSPAQALLAAKAGATYVSPFIGRLDDIGHNGMKLIKEIRIIFDNYDFDTQILAASTRHTLHIVQCAKAGADVCTLPFKVLEALVKHPLTDKGLEIFLADYHKAFPK